MEVLPDTNFLCVFATISDRDSPAIAGHAIIAAATRGEGSMAEIRTQLLFTIALKVGKLQTFGRTPFGERRIGIVDGGSFEGPKLKGIVLEGGSDWLLGRGDGVLQLDVRLTLKTDDDELIGMTYRGLRHGPAAVIDRLNRGETVDPSEYYFRTAPVFETASEKYAWLNRIIAVGTGQRLPQGPVYSVFEVL
jgi:uncharacterized protein DUF3237